MTTTTPDTIDDDPGPRPPPSARPSALRFVVAFVVGSRRRLGARRRRDVRLRPAVRRPGPARRERRRGRPVRPLAGAARAQREAGTASSARARSSSGPTATSSSPTPRSGRRADIDAMVAEALAVGRAGNPSSGSSPTPAPRCAASTLTPRSPTTRTSSPTAIAGHRHRLGPRAGRRRGRRQGDESSPHPTRPRTAARSTRGALAAPRRRPRPRSTRRPSSASTVATTPVEPTITTVEAFNAKALADRLTGGSPWTSRTSATRVDDHRGAPDAGPRSPDRRRRLRAPSSTRPRSSRLLSAWPRRSTRRRSTPRSRRQGRPITGVTPSKNGYTLDIAATQRRSSRRSWPRRPAGTRRIEPPSTVKPVLTTAEAEAARPKMKRISSWTTYFPICEKNGFGANIWIPARLINGYVVAPGETFDFWDAVGPVTRAKGYKRRRRDHQRPDRAAGRARGRHLLVLHDAVQRGAARGLRDGRRRNHYYYIDRYPLGPRRHRVQVAAPARSRRCRSPTTRTTRSSSAAQHAGAAAPGYVPFDLYSVPNGRKRRSAGRPSGTSARPPTRVQYTSSCRPVERVEYPVDGKDVWVTGPSVTRRARSSRRTYYSHYASITGIVQYSGTGD